MKKIIVALFFISQILSSGDQGAAKIDKECHPVDSVSTNKKIKHFLSVSVSDDLAGDVLFLILSSHGGSTAVLSRIEVKSDSGAKILDRKLTGSIVAKGGGTVKLDLSKDEAKRLKIILGQWGGEKIIVEMDYVEK